MKRLLVFVFISLGILLIAALLSRSFNLENQEANPPQKSATSTPTLSIPSLDISAPVIFADSRDEDDIQKALRSGVAHFPGTAFPGQTGNVYIVGHSSDLPFSASQYKKVFAKLPEMEIGRQIKITYRGDEFVYKVIETKVIETDDLSALAQPDDLKLLTLQTSYPVGTALRRFIVVTELIQ